MEGKREVFDENIVFFLFICGPSCRSVYQNKSYLLDSYFTYFGVGEVCSVFAGGYERENNTRSQL